jgi:two-component sensor histidine kinase
LADNHKEIAMPLQSQDARDAVRAAHHQIGNSLQSVVSLLRLEGRSARPEAAGVLLEASRRVQTVVRLHQRLQDNGGTVRLDDLLGDICRDVAELDALDRDAEIRIDVHPSTMDAQRASALAAVTAELVGNALEHGLARRSGRVSVLLAPAGESLMLTVTDDGEGAADGRLPEGFGLSLVRSLCRQLEGQFAYETSGSGTWVRLVLPV